MTRDDADEVRQDLERLQPLMPDLERAARVRARCRAQLVHRQRRSARRARIVGFGRRVLIPGVVLGLCALYVVSLVSTVLRLRSVF